MGWYFGYEFSEDYELPEVINIRRDGKSLAYARTGQEYAKIVTMNDIKDPGVYLAFPLFSDSHNIQRLVS